MARKVYPYSLDRKDAKIAGVASTIGAMTGIDPTFVRIGFVAAAIFISFKLTLIAYAAIGIYLAVQKKKSMRSDRRMSDFERMTKLWAIRWINLCDSAMSAKKEPRRPRKLPSGLPLPPVQ